MSQRAGRIVLGAVVGSVGVAIGLYLGRFAAGGIGLAFASSLQAVALATGVTWWLFIGLLCGVGLALVALDRQRVRFVILTLVGFGLGGALAAVPEMSRVARASTLAALAVPLGGALTGLVVGLAANLKARALVMAAVVGLAMFLARPYLEALIPPSDWIALLAPGALIGGALGALAPARSDPPPA